MKRIIKFLSLILILLLSSINTTRALDNTKNGSISITLKENTSNVMINDAEITIYFIGEASIKDNNLVFNKRSELTCNINLDNFNDNELIEDISKCINEDVIKYADITNNGNVKFNDLKQGLYLITQTKSARGYSNIDSFLVSIPKEENNNWVYDVNAYPKTVIYETIDLVIKKEWNTISNNIPKYVEIELYKDNNLIDTIKLNEENNWTYIFKNIEKSDKYSIKEINVPNGYTETYKVEDNVFTVTNSDTLPYTGQIFYPIIITFTFGLILIIFGIKVIRDAYDKK